MHSLMRYYEDIVDRADLFFEAWFNMDGIMSGFAIAGSLYMTLLFLELAWDIKKGNRNNIWEPLTNFSFYLVTAAAEKSLYGMIVGMAFIFLSDFAVSEIPINWGTWLICLVATDFTYYWMHRCEHKVRLFWTMHSVHHSSEEYDLTTAMRLFWFLDFTLWIFFAPLIILGFHGLQVLSCMVIVFTYMTWVHTDKIDKLGWFDRFFNSPSVHRVHHGANRQYIDKNYAGILVIWDRMFGSYEPEVEPVRFGLTKPVNSTSPIKVGLNEFVSLANDVRSADNWGDRFNYLFKGPGWSPAPLSSSPRNTANHTHSET